MTRLASISERPDARPNRGTYATEVEALSEVVSRLVRGLDPEHIWMFGSRAAGRHAPDSDFDLLVVTKVEDGEAGHDFRRAYAPILGLGVGCDVIPCRLDDFAEDAADPTSLCWRVLQTGKKLYERRAPDRGILHARG